MNGIMRSTLCAIILIFGGWPAIGNALTEPPARQQSSSWQPLPHISIPRRDVLSRGGAAASLFVTAASSLLAANKASAAEKDPSRSRLRSVASVDSSPVVPVWPSWGGGRVVPVSLEEASDPFLLLAHHKHWFDPRDPLRGPFKVRTVYDTI